MSDVAASIHSDESRTAIASQWQLTWWAFKSHRLAMFGLMVGVLVYFLALFCEFIAPDDPSKQNRRSVYHPPQMIHLMDGTDDGWRIRPHVYALDRNRDPETLAVRYEPSGEKIYLTFFGRGADYRFWGLFQTDIHLLVPRTRATNISCWAPIGLAATCSAGYSTAPGFRSLSGWSAWQSVWLWASLLAGFRAITAAGSTR